jgi:hypothetical protein
MVVLYRLSEQGATCAGGRASVARRLIQLLSMTAIFFAFLPDAGGGRLSR